MDRDKFLEACIAANEEDDPQAAVREVLSRAVADPGGVLAALGEPRKAMIETLYRSETLTILNAVWTPQMNLMPHNHLMWANIGIYSGREDNILWKQKDGGIEAYGVAALFDRDVTSLPVDAVHSVTNPLRKFTGGIHIYGGDFFETPRSMWDPETLEEMPSDGDVVRDIFTEENERLGLG